MLSPNKRAHDDRGYARGCLFSLDLLHQRQIRHANHDRRRRAIYGVHVYELDATRPSVVTINGVVASLAATEAVVYLTRLPPAAKATDLPGRSGRGPDQRRPSRRRMPLLRTLDD